MNILAAIFFIMIGLTVQFLTLGLGVFLLNILFKKNKLSDFEKLTCAYVLGITTTALFFFALLFTGLFYDGAVYAFGAIAIAVSLTQLNEIKKIAKGITSFKNFKKISFFSKAGLIVLFFNLLIYFLINLTPVTSMDALHYHLDLIKRWHLAHGFIHPDYWYASIPFNVEMLFMWGQIFKSEIISGLFNFVFLILCLIQGGLLIDLLVPAKNPKKASSKIFLALVLAVSPMTCYLTTGHFIEIPLLFLMLFSVYHMLRAADSPKQNIFIILSAIAFGFLLGSKTNLLAYWGIFVLCLIVIWHRQIKLKNIFLFVFVSLLIASPWYFKNLIYYNNPIYPFFSAENHFLYNDLVGRYGVGKNFMAAVLLPFNLLIHSSKFDSGNYLNPLCFLGLFSVLAFKLKDKKHFFIYSLAVLLMAFWFLSSQQARFLLIPLTLLLILGIVSLEKIKNIYLKNLIKGLFLTSVVVYTFANLYYLNLHIPYLTGQENKDQFLSRFAWHYPELSWVNEHLTGEGVIFTNIRSTYYLNKNYEKAFYDLKGDYVQTVLNTDRYQYFLMTEPVFDSRLVLIKTFETRLILRKVFGNYFETKTYLYKRI